MRKVRQHCYTSDCTVCTHSLSLCVCVYVTAHETLQIADDIAEQTAEDTSLLVRAELDARDASDRRSSKGDVPVLSFIQTTAAAAVSHC
jgi:hypothetical protein